MVRMGFDGKSDGKVEGKTAMTGRPLDVVEVIGCEWSHHIRDHRGRRRRFRCVVRRGDGGVVSFVHFVGH